MEGVVWLHETKPAFGGEISDLLWDPVYTTTCPIRHPVGNENSAGLAGCWIIEGSLYGKK